jgi:hypothetical protein
MKKIIFSLVAILALASCNHDAEVYTLNPQAKAVNDYNEAFVKAFGTVGSNVDWGFGTQAASTRTAQPNSNQWGTHDDNGKYLDWPKPADITNDERAAVLAVFNQKGEASYTDLLNLTDFFVQQVYCGPNGKKMNQLACWDPQGRDQMIYGDPSHNYQPYSVFTHDDEVNNFNEGKYDGNALQGCMLMWNSSTSQWSFKTSQSGGERIYDHWRMEYIPGYGYYVGLDHEAWRQAPANANEEDKRDYIYNDWIIKIVPGKGFTPPAPTYRVIAEDLNASEASDFDFNDVVFDVEPNEAGDAAKIVVRAAGGIYKLTVAGQEVHAAFGQSAKADGTYPMINTNPWNPDVKATLFESYSGNFDSDVNIRNTIKSIVIKVYKPGTGNDGIELKAETGKPACKILVDQTFNVVTERTGIADINTNFHKYVEGTWDTNVNGFWWKKN